MERTQERGPDAPVLRGVAPPLRSEPRGLRSAPFTREEAALFPALGPERIAALLKELADPTEAVCTDSMLPYEGPPVHEALPYFGRALVAASALAEVGPDPGLDALLLEIARTHAAWDSRCRALRVLVDRASPAVVELLGAAILSREPAERYLAWSFGVRAARRGATHPTIPVPTTLERYVREDEGEVRREIERYIGTIRAEEAVPHLVAKINAGGRPYPRNAVCALAMIGGEEARRLLLPPPHGENPTPSAHALGLLGAREAVPFLLTRLPESDAADALVQVGDRSCVPELERCLASLQSRPEAERNHFGEDRVRFAVLRLKHTDPCPALLDLLETSPDADTRRSAAGYLSGCVRRGPRALATRLAGLYLREDDEGVRARCLDALKDSRAPGVTEAMLRHVQVWEPHLRTTSPAYILRALNRRLGTAFATSEDVTRYLATRAED